MRAASQIRATGVSVKIQKGDHICEVRMRSHLRSKKAITPVDAQFELLCVHLSSFSSPKADTKTSNLNRSILRQVGVWMISKPNVSSEKTCRFRLLETKSLHVPKFWRGRVEVHRWKVQSLESSVYIIGQTRKTESQSRCHLREIYE